MYRWRGKYFEVDPDDPRAEGICDRCSFRWNLYKLQWQYDYQGTTSPQNTRLLVCPKCMDELNPQDQPYILPPDPMPVFNARPEPYVLDEASWLGTQDGDTITTQDGESLITPIPSPDDPPGASDLTTNIPVPEE